jgi:FkbM family methyltransferase
VQAGTSELVATTREEKPMASSSFAKRLGSRLPHALQQELKRFRYRRQIKRSEFGAGEPETGILHEYVKPGDWVLDVGANIGQYTWQLSELVGKSGRVLAIEPIPETFALLASNVQHFRHRNVSMLNVALSDSTGIAEMFIPRFDTGLLNYYQASLRHRTSPEEGGYTILKVRFDDLRIPTPFSLIKVDAEGHDESVLSGLNETLERDRPVLIVEDPTNGVCERMKSLGYVTRKLPGSPNTMFVPAKRHSG